MQRISSLKELYIKKIQSQQNLDDLEETCSKIDKQIRLQDLYNIMYLKPLQCKLNQITGQLPNGLLVVDRKSSTKYNLVQISSERFLSYYEFLKKKNTQQYDIFQNYLDYIQKNHGDNLLQQMKAHGQIQIAICICMYNEDRTMLENTLIGVGQNIMNLYKQGVDPDKIVVIIIQDGIQKMHPSVTNFFQILQNQSGMRYSHQKDLTIQQKIQKIQRVQQLRIKYGFFDENNHVDLNSFYLQKNNLKKKKYKTYKCKKIIRQYLKTLQIVIASQKKKNLTIQDLPELLYEQYVKICFADYLGIYEVKSISLKAQEIVQDLYNKNSKKYKPFILAAIHKTQIFCIQYLNSREDLAHVSFFRTAQFFPNESQYSTRKLQQIRTKTFRQMNHTFHFRKNLPRDQYTSIMKLKTDKQVSEDSKKFAIKMNIFFVVKYRNAQKLSSHNWFFNGFCKQFCDFQFFQQQREKRIHINHLSPKYTVLLDVGLRPSKKAIVKMYNAMINDSNIGGTCGYMGLKLQKNDQNTVINSYNLGSMTQFF